MKPTWCCLLFIAFHSGWSQAPSAVATGTGDLAKSRVFTPEQGSLRTMANGGRSRDILRGTLASGETIAAHESSQPSGAEPNKPHTIDHSELILVREGTLAFQHDGISETAGPGSLIYVADGTLHTVRNIGGTTATYVVIAVGDGLKK